MPIGIADLLESDFDHAIETGLPTSITMQSTTFNAVVSDITKGKEFEMAGFALDIGFTVIVSTTDISTVTIGESVVIDSVTYRVQTLRTPPHSHLLMFDCAED